MLKKLMAAVLTGAMIFALAVPAMADPLTSGGTQAIGACAATQSPAAGSENGYSMTVPGFINVPELKLEVEGTPWVVLNPYGMQLNANDIIANSEATTAQVIGADLTITNKSKADVIIGVKDLMAAPKGAAVISAKTLVGDTRTKTKSVFLILSVADTFSEAAGKTEVDATALSGTVQIGASAKTNAELYRIVKHDNAPTSGTSAHMTIVGNAVSAPTVSWASADGVTVTFKLTAKLSDDA